MQWAGLMKLDWTQGGLAQDLWCYRWREFFAAHEHWEGIWLATKAPEKAFLQALIQLAAELPTSSRITRVALCHCSGRRYSDLSPTRVCLEALLCHRCAKKFTNGCKSPKRVRPPELAVPEIKLYG